ncbi:NAD-dependent epimerase/dehydratase family protein [Streptomyces sp. CA-249302]|uniref:NAD-dependent epimerase/dehydratase family protein n=1 Tax=Streptomyces sp. CA-249302 TaxID=3240058 RepID=UPI003D8D3498
MAHDEPRDVPTEQAAATAVVLGATGFVGRHICTAFEAGGTRVLRVARGGARAGGGPVTAVDLLAASPARIARLLDRAGADVVVNAAGAVWGTTEAQMHQANAELPRRIVEALGLLPTRPRLIHLGSVHEYGPTPSGARIAEDLSPAPVGPYGTSKLLGARAVLEAAHTGRVDGLVLRIANVSGPGAPPGSLLGTVAAHLATALARPGRPAPPLRLAPLRARRDFVDARDVADAVVAAAHADAHGHVINIGSGQAVPVRLLTSRLIELSGLPVAVVEEAVGAAPRGGTGGRSDAEWQQLDISRAARLLDWRPRRTLDQSLRDLLTEAARECAALAG